VLARAHDAYLQEISWDADHHDLWLINSFDGTRKKILTHVRGNSAASPGGRYVTYFKDRHWHSLDVQSGEDKNLTEKLPVRFDNELWDQPSPAGAYGIAGWTENDEGVLLQDRYDLWLIKPRSGESVCVTDGYGRSQKIDFSLQRLDPEAEFVDSKKPLLLGAEDQTTRATGLFTESLGEVMRPKRLVMQDKKLSGLRKPKKSERLFFTATTFADCPDLWTVDGEFQQQMVKLTDANPQQREIRWGKAELVGWSSGDGKPLQGVLIKPEGFDPRQKYPMIVHFYERLSQTLHNYHAPAPGTSPSPAWYVSNGYLWFQPDIVYTVGYPGDSCFKCVVPGVQSLIAQGFVDPNAIAISGHSWGGYQTSYLVTRTTMFKAAEAGAPVSNMTSAYGGIRWSTGMSRAFQYEQTQSRIGSTLWEGEMRFLENSPLFFADKVTTPLLILHNDQDGAVPWYQGIEYFTALRRLGKEVYLFNYNGEDHGLRKRANMKDWTMRMAQFFDHHLKGAPAPKWMTEGVAYVEREKEKVDFHKKPEPVPAPKIEAQPAEASTGK
jgi:dienelactone hydrolase